MLIAEIMIITLSFSGFYQQYSLFRREKNTGEFSIYITAICINSAILRIFFYLIKPYAPALMVHNLMILVMTCLITYEYVSINHKKIAEKNMSFIQRFWNWSTFFGYLIWIVFFGLAVGIITQYSRRNDIALTGQIMASISTVLDISLCLPQIIKILKDKKSGGVSPKMIGIWLFSDSFRTGYLLLNNQPIQFIATGLGQASLDIILLILMFVYRQKSKNQSDNRDIKKNN